MFIPEAMNAVKNFGAGRLAATVAVSLILLGVLLFLIMRASQPTLVPLFTQLVSEDARAVLAELESRSIPYDLVNDGTTIRVPEKDRLALRLDLAGSGLIQGGVVGYELFDSVDALSTTSFLQSINRLRALEGELARTIMALRSVERARVHLVIPERRLFERDQVDPKASVIVRLARDLTAANVTAIQHLVASAVPGLEPAQVALVDEQGRLRSGARAGEDRLASSTFFDDATQRLEWRLARRVEAMLEPAVGVGKARAEVTLTLDRRHTVRQSDLFDPDSQVVRSSQTLEETSQSRDGFAEPSGAAEGDVLDDQSEKIEEVINYEISRTSATETLVAGEIRRISLALLVDGVYESDQSGALTYRARTPSELAQIRALAERAIGLDAARGDTIELVNLRFVAAPEVGSDSQSDPSLSVSALAFLQANLLRIIEWSVLLVLGMAFLFFAVRPLIKKATAPDESVRAALSKLAVETSEETAQSASRGYANLLSKAGELAIAHPDQAMSVIRQWLQDDAQEEIKAPGEQTAREVA